MLAGLLSAVAGGRADSDCVTFSDVRESPLLNSKSRFDKSKNKLKKIRHKKPPTNISGKRHRLTLQNTEFSVSDSRSSSLLVCVRTRAQRLRSNRGVVQVRYREIRR